MHWLPNRATRKLNKNVSSNSVMKNISIKQANVNVVGTLEDYDKKGWREYENSWRQRLYQETKSDEFDKRICGKIDYTFAREPNWANAMDSFLS
jgi:hypothetical protein